MARCGRCGTSFTVDGPGRYPCPGCGVTNEVREGAAPPPSGGFPGPAASPPPGASPPSGIVTPPPPPPPDTPSQRIACPDCDFVFIVGSIAVATCPNCGKEVDKDGAAPDPGLKS